MLNLFARTKVLDWEIEMLKKIFDNLPARYNKYKIQLSAEFLVRIRIYPKMNYIGFSYDPKMSKTIEDKYENAFQIKGIKILDLTSNKFLDLELHFSHGFIAGYSISGNVKKFKPDTNKIVVRNIGVEQYENENSDVLNLLSEDEKQLLNISEIYEVELNNKIYYHLIDLEDGDFIGIDKEKNVFRITHDPYNIEKIHSNLFEYLIRIRK